MGSASPRRSLSFIILLTLLLAADTLAVAEATAIRIMTQNLNRLFDDVDNGNREKIISTRAFDERIRVIVKQLATEYRLPHIIALQEIENTNVLEQLARSLERDHDRAYRGYLIPGQDVSGINLAFLIRSSIEVKRLAQLFAAEKLPYDGSPLFSRPPLLLEACWIGRCATLVNLHLRSMRGLDSDRQAPRVIQKRFLQATRIARWVQDFQQSRPDDALLLLGDFNALTPPDRHLDVAGIIRGNPESGDSRHQAPDLVEPDLKDWSTRIPANSRFSFRYRRNNQQLDYIFANSHLSGRLKSIEFGKIDYGYSDHAGLMAEIRW